jgi:hypothetical protein
MAWYLNRYECDRCGSNWQGEWSCMCDDDCPQCGARHMSPVDSDDLTEVIVKDGDEFVVLQSPENAEHSANYRKLGRFPTLAAVEAFLAGR